MIVKRALIACVLTLACRSASPAVVARPASAANDLQTGIALYQQGRYAEAEAALRSVPGAEASAYLAASLAKQKKFGEAEAPAKAALGENPGHDVAAAAIGESLVGQNKLDEAVDRLSAVIKANGGVAYAYYWRGKAYNGKKQQARAIDDFETFLKLAPKAPEAPAVQQLLAALK
jgi:tetratricopeptide (TPR) repeat protein